MMKPYRGTSQPPISKKPSNQSSNNQLQNRNNVISHFDDIHNHQMQIFKEFDDFSKKMFKRMDDDMGFGSLIPKFRGFDDIERQLMDFSDCKLISLQQSQLSPPQREEQSKYRWIQYGIQILLPILQDGPEWIDDNRKQKDKMEKQQQIKLVISERQQGYKNNGTGQDKFAHERMVDEKGRKYLKERDRTGQINQTNHFYNMGDDEIDHFDRMWHEHKQELGFGQFKNMLKSDNHYNQDINKRPFPKPQQQKLEQDYDYDRGYGHRRATDLQAIQMGGRENMAVPENNGQRRINDFQPQHAVHMARNDNYGAVGQQRNGRGKNEDVTGVYRNKNVGRNNYPQAG